MKPKIWHLFLKDQLQWTAFNFLESKLNMHFSILDTVTRRFRFLGTFPELKSFPRKCLGFLYASLEIYISRLENSFIYLTWLTLTLYTRNSLKGNYLQCIQNVSVHSLLTDEGILDHRLISRPVINMENILCVSNEPFSSIFTHIVWYQSFSTDKILVDEVFEILRIWPLSSSLKHGMAKRRADLEIPPFLNINMGDGGGVGMNIIVITPDFHWRYLVTMVIKEYQNLAKECKLCFQY